MGTEQEYEAPDGGQQQPPRRNLKKIFLVLFLVLVVGLAAGIVLNAVYGKSDKTGGSAVSRSSSGTGSSDIPGSHDAGGGSSSTSSRGETPAFSGTQALGHVAELSQQIGERRAGSMKESSAADYISGKLGEYGYTVEEQPFTTSDGFGSRNIIGTRQGQSEDYTIVIAAHYDSAEGTVGADDDASGVGVALELARVLAASQLKPTIQFVFFGANFPGSADMNERLVGSRHYVELLDSMERKDIVGVIDIDCVGQGQVLALKTQGTGLQRLKDKLQTFASKNKINVVTLNSSQDSDNIPFEDAEVPAVWVEWCEPGGGFSTGNAFASVEPVKLEQAGTLVESFVKGLTSNDLEELKY